MNLRYNIEGLDCANCALELEEILKNTEGVLEVSVNYMSSNIRIQVSDDADISLIKDTINHFEEVHIVENEFDEENKSFSIHHIISSIVIFIITFVLTRIYDNDLISYIGFGFSYIIVGYKVLVNTYISIKNKNFFDENFLMTIASISAILMSVLKLNGENQMAEATSIMILYQLGEYLQDVSVRSSRKSIKDILELKVSFGNKLDEFGNIIEVKSEELKVGDKLLVKTGEKVPTDSLIIKGESSFDTKTLTGESLPKFIKENEQVLSGYINVGDNVIVEVLKEYQDSAISKILDCVENSSSYKSKPEKFISKFAKIYTPIVCLVSLLVFSLGTVIESICYGYSSGIIGEWLSKGISILVISCPCALVISIPLSYFSSIGYLAKKGILVKGANKLDDLSKCSVCMFDKTGTLTYGRFEIINEVSSDKELMDKYVYALENQTNHPISLAFKKENSNVEVNNFENIIGKGLKGIVDNHLVYAGNIRLLEDNNIKVTEVSSPYSTIYCAIDNKYIGYYEIADKEKENIDSFIKTLKNNRITKTVLLTGDKKEVADEFNDKFHFDECYSELLPIEKMEIAKKYEDAIYIGDGINDIPVMSASKVSFSMGSLGSDIAVDSSDFVIANDDLMAVNTAIKTSKKCRMIVVENIVFSIVVKVLIMVFASIFVLPLWLSVLADVGVMLIAVLNSLRVRL